MINLASKPLDERIKLMTVMLANDMTTEVDYTLDRMSGSEVKEFASRCIHMLADSRLELASIKGL